MLVFALGPQIHQAAPELMPTQHALKQSNTIKSV